MSKLFTSLAQADPVSPEIVRNRNFPLWGRQLVVPESSGSVARFSFSDLCNKPLSAADYLEVTGRFETVFVEDVPRMRMSERDQARRFITFIDGECRFVSLVRVDGLMYVQHATKTRFV
jgi:protein AFG1